MKGERVTVGPQATVVAGADPTGRNSGPGSISYPTAAIIRIPSGSGSVWFGGSSVSSTSGCLFVAGEDLQVDLVNEILYGVATTSVVVHILRRGD